MFSKVNNYTLLRERERESGNDFGKDTETQSYEMKVTKTERDKE